MRILILGGGGREHALAWKIAQSPECDMLFCAPGNAGIAAVAECVSIDIESADAVTDFCKLMNVDFVIVGPEAPLVAGVADSVRAAGIACFGPSREAAELEASKTFTKQICDAVNAPTAAYAKFEDAMAAKQYINQQGAPIVIKADGLAAGKGVVVAMSLEEAEAAVDDMIGGLFGAAGASVVIEEFMTGEEASFFILCDGENILPIGTAQDHKRAYDGDEGPNTGGMGAYSPAHVLTESFQLQALDEIILPTVQEMSRRGTPYQGVLYAGLMLTDEGPKLVEYNARFGDPECQVLMMRLKSDILPILLATATGELAGKEIEWHDDFAMTVVMAAKGYPGSYEKGSEIKGLEGAENSVIFHAGTAARDGKVVATGGRVLNITAKGVDVPSARTRAYADVDRIDWPDGFCRRDIGWRAM